VTASSSAASKARKACEMHWLIQGSAKWPARASSTWLRIASASSSAASYNNQAECHMQCVVQGRVNICAQGRCLFMSSWLRIMTACSSAAGNKHRAAAYTMASSVAAQQTILQSPHN
jgi:hypothetical protein